MPCSSGLLIKRYFSLHVHLTCGSKAKCGRDQLINLFGLCNYRIDDVTAGSWCFTPPAGDFILCDSMKSFFIYFFPNGVILALCSPFKC